MMDRRRFLRTTGLGAATAFFGASVCTGAPATEQGTGEIDSRIEKHRKGRVSLELLGPDGARLAANVPVRIEQQKHKFLFGCNIFKLNRCKTQQDNDRYAERFAELLNFATLPFYWWNYERTRGKPDDARTAEIVRWCKSQGITTKGHPLAWNYIQPPWLDKDDPDTAMKLQLKRIARCVEKFEGDINIWDVVNEATHYDRPFCEQRAPALTAAIKKMGVGEYVRSAFRAARGANPNATLLINDYRLDPAYEKKVIAELKANGKPMYDVIGIQSHMHGGYWGAKRAWDVCETFSKYDVPLHFTETTVVSGPKKKEGWTTTTEGEEKQAEAVSQFYRVLFSHPAVEAITWWDFTDQNAWQQAPAGLVRADMTPKPAYERLMDLVKGKWWTKTEATTQPNGRVGLSGFYGTYEVSTQINGRKVRGAFEFDKSTQGPIRIQLRTA